MDFIDFGGRFGQKEIKFRLGDVRKIEEAGNTILKRQVGGGGFYANQIMDLLISKRENVGVNFSILDIVIQNAVRDVKDTEIDDLVESYVENVGDIGDLATELKTIFDNRTGPRKAEEAKTEAEKVARKKGKPPDQPKQETNGKSLKKSESKN